LELRLVVLVLVDVDGLVAGESLQMLLLLSPRDSSVWPLQKSNDHHD
jgi:hypothetical protein